MPKLKPVKVEIHPHDIKAAITKWTLEASEKFNDTFRIPDYVIERVSTSIYHQLKYKNSVKEEEQ